jgi:hypothetical protein
VVKDAATMSSHLCLPVASPDRDSPPCPGDLAVVLIPHSATDARGIVRRLCFRGTRVCRRGRREPELLVGGDVAVTTITTVAAHFRGGSQSQRPAERTTVMLDHVQPSSCSTAGALSGSSSGGGYEERRYLRRIIDLQSTTN